MVPVVDLTPLDPRYPSRLRELRKPSPPPISVSGGSLEASCTVAIVGSREATPGAARFAHSFAKSLASQGVGIDAAAHRGALEAGGRTWVVAGTGHRRCFPPENAALFDTIAEGPSAMIWPFGPDTGAKAANFTTRNGYLVGLSDAVIVVQAGQPSGAMNAATQAKNQGKPLWVVPAAPWLPWLRRFAGSALLLSQGARPLVSLRGFLASLGLGVGTAVSSEGSSGSDAALEGGIGSDPGGGNRHASHLAAEAPPEPPAPRPLPPLSDQESAALRATGPVPRHTDAISQDAGLTPQATAAALLTLALENVLVEGPPGFFRRQDAYNR
jgi:DNA processing protein